ncbi:hypothetical protein BHE74_00001410 [Ensete ventricosum]|uniref:Integrase zinc-binding domain-containing protein n=1 Tax=Ensete ventricosum TaxID=4639 RepID=A0A445M8E1_ENSVE|nr:hypothetical protein BHE74_00001410 [Ensete ventricosum]RZR70512.1 hypothetical protein BHM03_00000355 [Ensete ventricosum]
MGDLVLRKAEVIDPEHSCGKFPLRWGGPYRVIRTIQDETYTIATMDGGILPRTWHVSNLKKNYA